MLEKMAQVLKGGVHTHQPLGLRNVALGSGSTAPPVCIVLPLLVYWLCDHVEKQQIAKGQDLMVVVPRLAELVSLGERIKWRKFQE